MLSKKGMIVGGFRDFIMGIRSMRIWNNICILHAGCAYYTTHGGYRTMMRSSIFAVTLAGAVAVLSLPASAAIM